MTAEESVILSRILARFRRPWLAALFLGVVVVESSLLLVLVVGNFASSARYGGFQYGCPTLQATPVSTNSSVRWTRLGCPNGPALVLSHSMFDCATRENSCTLIVPTFTPPDGLLALFTVDHASPCPDDTHPSLGAFMWSGVSELYGWGNQATSLDYCAVTRTSVGTLAGFSVQWSLGEGTTQIPYILPRAPVTIKIARGGSIAFALNVTSRYGFYGNVSFSSDLIPNSAGQVPPSISFSPQSLTLSNGGSNSTTVTVQASSYTTPVSWYVDLNASPVFGLEHYGDFGLPSRTNYATVEIDVT